MKKTIALILALTMIFTLCACGKTSKEEVPEATPVPEFGYKSTYKELNNIGTDDYLNILLYTDDGFYGTYNEVVGERDHEGEEKMYEGQFDIYEGRLVFVDYDGKVTRLSNYVPEKAPEAGENQFSYSASVYINSITREGNDIYLLEIMYESWFSEEGITYESENYWDKSKYTQSYFLSRIDENGTKLSTTKIDVPEDVYLGSSMVLDRDGNLLLTNGQDIRALGQDGTVKYQIAINGYCESICKTSDGTIYVLLYPEDGNGAKLFSLDQDQKGLTESCDCPNDAYSLVAGRDDSLLYYNSGVTFSSIDPKDGTVTRLFNWLDLDINGNNAYQAAVLSGGKVVSLSNTYDSDTRKFSLELNQVEKVPYESIPKKTSITLATQGIGYDASEAIVKFNRSNDKYHIDVIDYSQYNTPDDYQAGVTKMTTEIMAGNIPDIIDLQGMPLAQLASKKILEDLYPYIDRDFNRADFFENVLKACEINGNLYTTVPGFSIQTVIGASAIVGDEPGWTYAEFNEALASMPDGCTPFENYVTRDQILYSCLGLDLGNFINWETGEVDFNNDEFMDLLKFAKSFPESFDWENYDYTDEKTTSQRIASGEQMLETGYVYSLDDIYYTGTDFGGAPITYVGYPTNNGTGNMINIDSGFAMTTACADKEAAWSFLKTFFEESYQKNVYNIPISKNLFEQKMTKAMTPEYLKDANGNILIDEETGEKKMMARFSLQNANGEWEDYYCLSEEQANQIRNLVNSTTKMYTYDEAISSIVNEEAQAFFKDQKSVEEIAKLIQSKVNIYVNEQR